MRGDRARSVRATALTGVLGAFALLPLLLSPWPQDEVVEPVDVAFEPSDPPAPREPPRRTVPVAGDDLIRPRPVIADSVATVRPHLIIRPDEALDPAALFAIVAMEEISHLATAVEVDVTVRVDGQERDLRLLVVDVATFRPLTPESTAQATAVWERLSAGELVVRHDIAQGLQLPLGGDLEIAGPNGEGTTLRIGAFASNGSPPFADGIVPWSVADHLGAGSPNLAIVSVGEDVDVEALGARISDEIDGQIQRIEQPAERRASMASASSTRFEAFSYRSHGDGMIRIDPAWVRRWIVRAEVPIFGEVTCHRTMIPQLRAALHEVEVRGLDRYIDRRQYGGCWVPRHILFDPSKPISMHAWGLAIDFNVSTNQYGAEPEMPPQIVEIFERWGFRWGGHWSTPDGMHFELRTVVTP